MGPGDRDKSAKADLTSSASKNKKLDKQLDDLFAPHEANEVMCALREAARAVLKGAA